MEFTAIILSYKRPWNIQTICETILTVNGMVKLVLSNNNPDINLSDYVNITDSRLLIINQTENCKCIKRFEIALSENSEYFFCIDDDLFLSRSQIEYLMAKLILDPSRPHGCWGQQINLSGQDISLISELDKDTSIDILNRAYFFTRKHVVALFNLMDSLELTVDSVGPCDDILLSYSGTRKAMIHLIGWFVECPSSNEIGIALWREEDFAPKRLEMIKRIWALKDLATYQSHK